MSLMWWWNQNAWNNSNNVNHFSSTTFAINVCLVHVRFFKSNKRPNDGHSPRPRHKFFLCVKSISISSLIFFSVHLHIQLHMLCYCYYVWHCTPAFISVVRQWNDSPGDSFHCRTARAPIATFSTVLWFIKNEYHTVFGMKRYTAQHYHLH